MEESPTNVICANFQHLKTANLNTHMKVHSGGKSNKCHQCKFATSRTAKLRIHIREHSGEKSTNVTDVIICTSNRQIKFA